MVKCNININSDNINSQLIQLNNDFNENISKLDETYKTYKLWKDSNPQGSDNSPENYNYKTLVKKLSNIFQKQQNIMNSLITNQSCFAISKEHYNHKLHLLNKSINKSKDLLFSRESNNEGAKASLKDILHKYNLLFIEIMLLITIIITILIGILKIQKK